MNLLALFAVAASNALHAPCATIDNTHDWVAWKRPGHNVVLATYRDVGGRLVYSRPAPLVARMAARTLGAGPRGPKLRLACNLDARL